MNTNSNPRDLTAYSDPVRQNYARPSNLNGGSTNSEVIIRPLPPEIEKLVRKYLSRY